MARKCWGEHSLWIFKSLSRNFIMGYRAFLAWDGDLGHLEREVAAMADDLRADFDELPRTLRRRWPGLARRQHLCANQGILSRRRARSLHRQNHRDVEGVYHCGEAGSGLFVTGGDAAKRPLILQTKFSIKWRHL